MDSDERLARRLKLRDLHTLQAVAEAGSMAKAAGVLAVTQSAISKTIADMEETLGVPLLDRTARGVEPTPFGRILLRRGRAIFDEVRQGVREIEFLADPTAGEVRIGTTEPMAAIASAAIDRLSRRYPRLVFHVVAADTLVLFRALHERTIELAISRMVGSAAEEDLEAEELFRDPLVVVAGRDVRQAHRRRPLRLADLIGERWILGPPGSFLRPFMVEAFRAEGLDLPPATVTTYSVYMRNSLLATGGFLTILPRAMLRDASCSPSIAALPIDLPTTERPIGLVKLRRRSLSPVAQLFADCARAVAQDQAVAGAPA
jgi:DNA-binding transcriptional LysR family regulator